jgi:hypothetical protein
VILIVVLINIFVASWQRADGSILVECNRIARAEKQMGVQPLAIFSASEQRFDLVVIA